MVGRKGFRVDIHFVTLQHRQVGSSDFEMAADGSLIIRGVASNAPWFLKMLQFGTRYATVDSEGYHFTWIYIGVRWGASSVKFFSKTLCVDSMGVGGYI